MDPLAYLYGELERSRDRIRRRVLTADQKELVELVIADIVAGGYLDEAATRDAELREHIAFTVDFIEGQNRDWLS